MKKRILSLMVALMLVLPLGLSLAQDAQVTLTVLWFNDANESDVFLDTVSDYLADHPNVKVEMQVIAFDAYEKQLKLMLAGGNAPDIARMPTALMPAFAETLEPVENHADITEIEAAFAPSMLAFAKNSENQLVAYPTEATANGMIVNKTAFEKAGIDVVELSQTWTWDQWEEAVKKVIAASDTVKYGLAVDFTPHRFSTLIYQFGGRMMSDDLTSVHFENEGTINTIKWFKRMHDEGLIPQSVWLGSEKPVELFQAGLVAGHIGGSWNINTYTDLKDFEWAAVQSPAGEIRSSVPGGKFVAGFKDSKNKEAAFDLMAWFSDAEHNAKYCLDTNNLSSRVDVDIQYPVNTESFTVFSRELQVTPTYTAQEWNAPIISRMGNVIKEQVVQALMGAMSAEEACAEIDRQALDMMQ